MLTTEERRKLRDEKVLAALREPPKLKKKKVPERKPGVRPADAKTPPAPVAPTMPEDDENPKKK